MRYLQKIWGGELPLWKVYWLWGTLGNAVLTILVSGLNVLVLSNVTSFSDFEISLIFNTALGVVLAYSVLICVGIWRSATKYSEQNINKGWGSAAKVMVVLGAIVSASNYLNSDALQSGSAMESLQMESIVVGLNRDLPQQVDEITRLEEITYSDSVFVSYYTLTGSAADRVAVRENAALNMATSVCEDETMQEALVEGISYRYVYSDPDGSPVADVNVSASTCSSIESLKLEAEVRRLNKGLPRQLDEITSLDQINKSGLTYVYHHTITGFVDDLSVLKDNLKINVVRHVCENEVLKAGFSDGLSYRYIYSDPDANPLADIVLTDSACE